MLMGKITEISVFIKNIEILLDTGSTETNQKNRASFIAGILQIDTKKCPNPDYTSHFFSYIWQLVNTA